MITVTKIFEFEAAHHLPNYKGDCHNMHGHTYKLEVTTRGVVSEDQGMVVDFKLLKEMVQTHVVDILDHEVLNNHVKNPTAENLVVWIREQLSGWSPDLRVCRIRLWETSTSYCEWIEGSIF